MQKALAFAAVLMTSTSFATAQEATRDTVLATVNGVEITLGQVAAVKRNLPATYADLPDETLLPGILTQLIEQEVLAQSLQDAPSWLADTQIVQQRSLRAEGAVANIEAEAATEDALRTAYEAYLAENSPEVEWNASHILVKTEDEAKALVTALEGGADFAELAKEKSTGPSGPNGGSLGWFQSGMMVPEFETAVSTMRVEGISAPVQTQFGWHVIRLNESRTAPQPSFEDMRADLAQQLGTDAVSQRIDALIAEGNITQVDGVDPSALSAAAFD